MYGRAGEKVAGGVGVGHRVGVVDVEDQGKVERVGAGGQGFVQDAVAPDVFEGDAALVSAEVVGQVAGGDRPGAQGAFARDQDVPVGGVRPGGVPVVEPGQQGVAGELAEGLGVAGDADAPAGQVDVFEGEFADGPGAGGVHGRQGDDQALGGSGGRLLDSPDLLGGHRQHGAPGTPAAAEVGGGVGERQAVSFGKPEQRAQRHDGVVAAVTAQRLQDGVDVTGGDLPQVAACCCPALDEGPHDAEVDPQGGVRSGAGTGVTVEQHHQPGTHVAAESGGQFAGAAVDPGPDRRGGVVVQELQL